MGALEIVLGVLLILASLAIIVIVMMQKSREGGLSGAIAGGSDTFFGKNKGQAVSKKLSVLTSIVAVIFVLLVCTVYVRNAENKTENETFWEMLAGGENEDAETEDTADKADEKTETTAAETTAAETTAAETTAE